MMWREFFSTSLPFIAIWWFGGVLTVTVPITRWNAAKQQYYNDYGHYSEYDENNNSQGGYQGGQYEQQQYYTVQSYDQTASRFDCDFWDWSCRQGKYYYVQQEQNRYSFYVPRWYQFIGGRLEIGEKKREEMGLSVDHDATPMHIVYGWSLAMFFGILIFGTTVMVMKRALFGLTAILFVLVQYSAMMLMLVTQGVISTNDEQYGDNKYGWSGQMGVLLAYFFFAKIIFGLVFIIVLSVQAGVHRVLNGSNSVDGDGFGCYRRFQRGETLIEKDETI